MIGLESRRRDSLFFDEAIHVAHIHGAPNAIRLTRRETDHVALGIDTLSDAVNPSKVERFIDRLGPGNARLARILLVEADPELFRFIVIGREPLAEGGRGFEEFGDNVQLRLINQHAC